jgi:GNAT superfamily N-acetyltransferase
MGDLNLSFENAPAEADVQFVLEQLIEYNLVQTGIRDYQPLAVFLRDDSGEIVGGLTGFTWGGTLKIEILWVREDQRGSGYGARMLAMAEDEARRRGCRQAILDTHSFQAPEFYPKHGYIQCGVADDWPRGHKQYYFQKRLDAVTP